MVSNDTLNRYIAWKEQNKMYLNLGRPSKKTLLRKLNKSGFNLTFDELNYLIQQSGRSVRKNTEISQGTNIWVPAEMVDTVKELNAIYRESKNIGLPVEDVKHGWLKTQDASMFFTNPLYKGEEAFDINSIDFKNLFNNLIENIDIPVKENNFSGEFDKLVISDIHIGMDASNGGESLYDVNWNKEELFKNLEICIKHVVEFQKSKTLYIAELGDFADGWDGYTTRGGHKLPQNMSNNEVFENGLLFKINLVQNLLKYYDKIIFRSVVNNNHGGAFDEIISTAFYHYCKVSFNDRVEVITQKKFLDYEIINNRLFIYCHGKDKQHMKFGFKVKINSQQINKILGYLNANNLLNKGYDISFFKGDSHQMLFDYSSSDVFKYFNFPSFAPQSDWVAHNFQRGTNGFVFFNYRKDGVSINDKFFTN
jgi:hypothetical protein